MTISLQPETTAVVRCTPLDGAPAGARRGSEPVTCGLPWPQGAVGDAAQLVLLTEAGRPAPLAARCLDRWPDGSVRWALLDWRAEPEHEYRIGLPTAGEEVPAYPALEVEEAGPGKLQVSTGRARFLLGVGDRFPFHEVEIEGMAASRRLGGRLVVEDASGAECRLKVSEAELLENGPVRASIRLGGALGTERSPRLLEFSGLLSFFADSAAVRFELSLTNWRAAKHPGGIWQLGSKGSVYLRDASFVVRLPQVAAQATVLCSAEAGLPFERLAAPVELYQDSSGGENWDSHNHLNRDRRVPFRFQGYSLRSGESLVEGRRATPCLLMERGGHRLAIAMRQFWQNCPKALEADEDSMTLRLFPHQFDDLHEIQGGEQKTHSFIVDFAVDRHLAEPLPWVRRPLLAHATPEWYALSGAIPQLLPASEDPHAGYARLVAAAIEGDDTFEHKRELIDEYGWRNFGDISGDHEAVHHRGEEPLVSHYNNQYDAVWGFAVQFMRSADPRWFRQMCELAEHVVDIDIYHTDGDKSAYNRGMFWHTFHYVDADLSSHRSYPSLPGVPGGGPSTGHLYTTGLLHHHFLTGSWRSREAVLQLARYVIDADDGGKTIVRFLDRGPSGYVSESGFDGFQGPGRSPANAIAALLDGHRLSGRPELLHKAEQLIRRCIHPRDDLEARNLPDAEHRWFYTMFLHSLGRYLDHKAERGELDGMYAYGRASLLHYASWAAEHEYPYLDRPEGLEHPTETWAAQDMRKCEVFQIAARHAANREQRSLFAERAGFFFESSVSQLRRAETRTLCRPVVLLLSLGFTHAHFLRHPDLEAPRPEGSHDFGRPRQFESQKQRAKRKLKWLAGIAGALLTLAALAAIISFGI